MEVVNKISEKESKGKKKDKKVLKPRLEEHQWSFIIDAYKLHTCPLYFHCMYISKENLKNSIKH